MELVSSRDVIDFLSKSAPRPWVKRLLFALIIDEVLTAYFEEGESIANVSAWSALWEIRPEGGGIEEAKALIEDKYSPEVAHQLRTLGEMDRVSDVVFSWRKETDEPRRAELGCFLYARHIDWEAGTLELEPV